VKSVAVGAGSSDSGCGQNIGNGPGTSGSSSGWPYELPSALAHWWWMA
jgi:hypothetical protein